MRDRSSAVRTDRAVSNTLGYVLLFSVVFLSFGAVATGGVQSLEAVRDTTTSMTAEQSMEGVARAAADLHRENVTTRTSTIALQRGSLEYGEASTINVSVDTDGTGRPDASTSPDVRVRVQPLVYTAGDTRLLYVAGAVFRLQNDAGRVVREPQTVFDDDVILPVIATETPNPGASIGGTSVEVRMTQDRSKNGLLYESFSNSDGDVTVEVDAPTERRAALWGEALDDEVSDGCSVTGSTMTCTHSPSSSGGVVIVRTTTIRLVTAG